jgi:opacity protein-like surface antigen
MILQRLTHRVAFAALLCVSTPATAAASEGPLAAVAVSATTIESGTSTALSASAGYQFNSVFGLGVELTFVPSLNSDTPLPVDLQLPELLDTGGIGTAIYPLPIPRPIVSYSAGDGRATVFTTNLRLEIPTTSGRLVPFVVAGGGVGTVREEFTIDWRYPDVIIQSPGGPLPIVPSRSISQPSSRVFTDLALTLGGGVSVRAADRLWIDADLRYLALVGARDLHVGRFGGGVSYRF